METCEFAISCEFAIRLTDALKLFLNLHALYFEQNCTISTVRVHIPYAGSVFYRFYSVFLCIRFFEALDQTFVSIQKLCLRI